MRNGLIVLCEEIDCYFLNLYFSDLPICDTQKLNYNTAVFIYWDSRNDEK